MRCQNCKSVFIPKTFLQKYCLERPECVEIFIKKAKETQWKQKKATLKADLMTVQDHLKLAQSVFNKWIRARDLNNPCISCGQKINGVTHASHYKSQGGHSNVRFNEDNVWSSCYKCNVQLSGNLLEYRKALLTILGFEKLEQLETESMKPKQWTIDECKEINKIYKRKIKELE